MKLGLSTGFTPWQKSGPSLRINEISPAPQQVINQDWMDINNFSAVFEVVDADVSANSGTRFLFHMGDSVGANNQIQMFQSGSDSDIDYTVSAGGAWQGNDTRVWEALQDGKKQRWGITSDKGTVSFYLNGILIDQFIGITQPTSTPEVGIGSKQNANGYPGTINSFQMWDGALPRAKMESLTAVDDLAESAIYDPSLNIIPVYGQSNAVGLGGGSNTYSNSSLMKMITGGGALDDYSDPPDPNAGELFPVFWNDTGDPSSIGAQGEILDTLAGLTSETWAVHTCAKGGTALIDDWNPLQDNSSSKYRISNTMFTALQRLLMAKAHGNLRAFVWIQGERDAANNNTGAAYTAKLTQLIDLVRYYGGADLPFICVSIHDSLPIGSYPSKADIRSAQSSYSERSNYYVVAGDGHEVQGDNVHYTSAGYNTLGAAIASSIYSNILS